MQNPLWSMEAKGLITPDEAQFGELANLTGVNTHTIGYELEVADSAARVMPRVPQQRGITAITCQAELRDLGFSVGEDSRYEIKAPPALHPTALAIATQGIVKTGWLPERTSGLIAAHISIGTPSLNKPERLLELLRAIELNGHSSPRRLMDPMSTAEAMGHSKLTEMEYTWACKGIGGVLLHNLDDMRADDSCHTIWVGNNSRSEFRTLQYHSAKQFSAALNTTYYLTRGFFADEDTPTADIYESFEDWLINYFTDNRLPSPSQVVNDPDQTVDNLRNYIEPYAQHLAQDEKTLTELRNRTDQAMRDICEELGMTTFFNARHLPESYILRTSHGNGLPQKTSTAVPTQ